MKKKKILFSLSLLIVTFVSGIYLVNAATQTWNTYLEISTGSTVTGTKRSHSYANQSIEFHWTEIGVATTNPPTLNVTLFKKGLLKYSAYNSTSLEVPTNATLSLLTYNSSGSGKYYFSFGTGTAFNPTGYFKANPVYVKSYS